MICSDIIKGGYQLLGRPSQGDLPYQDVLEHAADVVRGRLIDLRLSARNHGLQMGAWFTPSATEGPVVGVLSTNFIPVKVEWRYTDTDIPYTAQVTSYEQLSEMTRKARIAKEVYVAFYGQNMAFGELLEDMVDKEFRVIYEDFDGYDGSLTASTNIPDFFITLCKYELAIRCLDQVENSEAWAEKRERLRMSLTPLYLKEEQRFDKWKTQQYGQKKVTKQGFRVGRYRH